MATMEDGQDFFPCPESGSRLVAVCVLEKYSVL
jgi:hypothetical protein